MVIETLKSVLLHTCCGPCAISVVRQLREQGLEVAALWYNPNIHPFREHQRRLEAMQALAQKENLPLIIPEGYDMIRYFRTVVGHEGDRCIDCYRLRLSKGATVAREQGYSAFTTTLLSSPHQKHKLLRQIGEELGRGQGVRFYYQDFRPGFAESQRLARELELYRQPYCGCVYSEWERYAKIKITSCLSPHQPATTI